MLTQIKSDILIIAIGAFFIMGVSLPSIQFQKPSLEQTTWAWQNGLNHRQG